MTALAGVPLLSPGNKGIEQRRQAECLNKEPGQSKSSEMQKAASRGHPSSCDLLPSSIVYERIGSFVTTILSPPRTPCVLTNPLFLQETGRFSVVRSFHPFRA